MNATEDKTYNGWTNYETWAVGMFLDGNYTGEGTYLEVQEMAKEEHDRGESANVYNLAERLRCYVEDQMDDAKESLGASLASDLLGAAVSEVNWHELAENKLSEF